MKAKSPNTRNKRFEHVICMCILATIMVLWGIIIPTSASATEEAHETPTIGDVFQVNCDSWNVRTAPEYGADIAYVANDGEIFQLVEELGSYWYRIEAEENGYFGNCYVNIAPDCVQYFSKINVTEPVETTIISTTEAQTITTTTEDSAETVTTETSMTTVTMETQTSVSTTETSTTETTTNGEYELYDIIMLNSDSWNLRKAPEYGADIAYVANDGERFQIVEKVGSYWYRIVAERDGYSGNYYVNIMPDCEQYFSIIKRAEPSGTTATTENSTATTTIEGLVATVTTETSMPTVTMETQTSISTTETSTTETTTNGEYELYDIVMLNSDSWNIRKAPEYGAEIAYVANDGECFQIVEKVGSYWYRIVAERDGYSGNYYVNIMPDCEQYFSIIKRAEPSETTATTENSTATTVTMETQTSVSTTETSTTETTTNEAHGEYELYDIIMLNCDSWNIRVSGNSDADIAYTASKGQLFRIVSVEPGYYWYKVEDLSRGHFWNYIQITPECEQYFEKVKSNTKSTTKEMIRLNNSNWNVYENYQEYDEIPGGLHNGEVVEVLYADKAPWILVQREFGTPVWIVINNEEEKYFEKVTLTTSTTAATDITTTTSSTTAATDTTTTTSSTMAATDITTTTSSTTAATDTTTTTGSTTVATDTTTITSSTTTTETSVTTTNTNTTPLSVGDRVIFRNTSWYIYKTAGQDILGVITNLEEFVILENNSAPWYLIMRAVGGEPVWIRISEEGYKGNFIRIESVKHARPPIQ